jgi:hypothetical protein
MKTNIALTLITGIAIGSAAFLLGEDKTPNNINEEEIALVEEVEEFTIPSTGRGNLIRLNSPLFQEIENSSTNLEEDKKIQAPQLNLITGAKADNNCKEGTDNTKDCKPEPTKAPGLGAEWLSVTKAATLNMESNSLTHVDGLSNLTIANSISLKQNNLTNVNGLKNLTKIWNSLDLGENQIEDVSGLKNLTSVDFDFSLNNNELRNVNGLEKLLKVGGNLDLRGNSSLTNISALSNLQSVGGFVFLDDKEMKVKMDANSYLCQNFELKVFKSGFAGRSSYCK